MNISISARMAVLKEFFDGIEAGLFDVLREQSGADGPKWVIVGDVKVTYIYRDTDIRDINRFFNMAFIRFSQFLDYADSLEESEIYVGGKLSLESLDKRVKKLEGNR